MTGSRQREIPEHPVIWDMERYGYVRGRRRNPPVTAAAVTPPFHKGGFREVQGKE